MEAFVSNVKKNYHDRRINYDEEHWPPNHSGKLLTLDLVTKKKGEHYFASHLQSSNEKAFKQVSISYGNLFKSDRKPVRRVLVEGSAGIGKTSLCISISKDWADGNFFPEYKLLLLIPLHQPKVALARSLTELIKNFTSEIMPSVVNHLEESKGEGVLMIADGWDKLSVSKRQKGSFFHNLLFGNALSLASVLVTSRPSASALLHKEATIDQFIEVIGFSKQSIDEYIQSEVEQGVSHPILDYNPLLESICKVPVICTAMCHIWRTVDHEIPSLTMTKLTTKVILNVMSSFTWKRGTFTSLSEVDTLPKNLQASWWRLCQLAFETLSVHNHQINPSSIDPGNLIETAGFVEVAIERNGASFHFLHPIFQEYLIALHIVKQPHLSQLKILDMLKSHQFTMFWQYFFGVCMEYDQNKIVKHAVRVLSATDLPKSLFSQCAFEARNNVISNEIIKALSFSYGKERAIHFGDPKSAYACAAVLYVINSMQGLVCGMEINFKDCSLDSKIICKLADILAKQPDQLQVKSLDLSNNGLSDDSIASLFHRADTSFQLLEKLFLRSNRIGSRSITAIVIALAKSPSQSVIQLDLSLNPLTLTALRALQNGIKSSNFIKLEILFMHGSLTTDANVNLQYLTTFADVLLLHCRQLRRLDISGNDFGDSVTPTLSRIISKFISSNCNFDLCMNREYMSEVDKKFVAIMQDCVKQKGTIDHTVAHGVIVGPGRSGKNSLMKRLVGEGPPDPNTISPSTGVLETVVKVEVKKLCTVAAAVNNLVWKKLEYDEEALELMMTTAKSHTAPVDALDLTHDHTDNSQEAEIFSSAIVMVERTGSTSKRRNIRIAKGAVVPMDTDNECTSVLQSSDILAQERPLDIFKRAVKLRRMDVLREHLESSWSLYLTNTGGQMEFQELLPILVCGPSVFFITFPLDKSLHEHYTVQYQYPDGSKKAYPSPSTLMDEILQTLATIAALDCTGPLHEISLKPKVFFVGTHKDILLESSADDTIQNIDMRLQKAVRQTSLYRQGSVEFAVGTKQLVFTVNNLDKSDSDFQKIRLALQRSVERSDEFTITCPSTWLVFSLVLRAKHKSCQVLSYNDCFTIAQSCGITDRTELNNALFFIHTRLGLVRYFCVKELNYLVIIDPQILFDKITKLIVETFISDHANVSEIEEFQKRGIFSIKVMERISKKNQTQSDTQLSFAWLLKLLNHLKIAAFFVDDKGDQKCFFPSVLCHAPKKQSVDYSYCQIKLPPPLMITFKSGFCPRGIPGALIKYLMTNEMKSYTSWELYPSRVFRNQVSFGVGPCDIMLTIHPTHLEVCFDPESDAVDESEVKETCRETFMQLQQAMKDVTEGYCECDYFFTFSCTRPECEWNPHPAEIDWRSKKLRCKVTDRRSRLPSEYQLWIPQMKDYQLQQGGLSYSQRLDLEIDDDGVLKHLGQIADSMCEWEGCIAEQLGLIPADIAAIKMKYPNELRLQIRAALEKWKQTLGSSATYNNLIGVFERAGYLEYADAVRKLIVHSMPNSDKVEIPLGLNFHVSTSEPLLLQPVFPELDSIPSSLPSATTVILGEQYQEFQGQAIEQSIYLKAEQVLEPVDMPSESDGISDDPIRKELTSSKQPQIDTHVYNRSKQQFYAVVSDEMSLKTTAPHQSSQSSQELQTIASNHNETNGADDILLATPLDDSGLENQQVFSDSREDRVKSWDLRNSSGEVQHKPLVDISDEGDSHQSQSNLEVQCIKKVQDSRVYTVGHAHVPIQNESSPQSAQDSDNKRLIEDVTVYTDQLIGTGAFGCVFKGEFNGVQCAVKVLNSVAVEILTDLPVQSNNLERFKCECKMLQMIQHKNIVRYIATRTLKSKAVQFPILVMELLDENLRKYLLNIAEISLLIQVSLSIDVASGLEYLHHTERQIVHRDLCCDNILLSMEGVIPVAKISDFGLSRILGFQTYSRSLSALGHRVGYLPPEAALLSPTDSYDSSLDVFMFGVVMTQIATKAPHIHSAKQRQELVTSISIDHPLCDVIIKCLQDDRTERPNAGEVRSVLCDRIMYYT